MVQRKVIAWSVIIALGGFIFGFDTVVISGGEQDIQKYWQLGTSAHGLTTSIAIIGTMLGALFGGIPADKIGRKKLLIIIALMFLVSAIGTALVTNWYLFLSFRFIGGVGVGASSVIAPIFISEISPARARGRLVILFQTNIVFGIVIAYLSNLAIFSILGHDQSNAWRYMLGVMAVPSVIFLALLPIVPESPRWLLLQGRNEEAERIFKDINPQNFKQDIATIVDANKEESAEPGGDRLFSARHKFQIILAILIAFFNQTSGINAILYYAPRIFTLAGFSAKSSYQQSLAIGIVNFTFTLIAIAIIDKLGRRKMMFIGSFGLILTLGLVAYAFFKNIGGYSVVICLCGFIAFFAFSQGAVIWVFISEIFPNQVRAKGQALGSCTHWLMAALITFVFPWFAANIGANWIFSFFTVMMVLQLLFVWKLMPETKGTSLEDMEHTIVH